MNHNHSEKRKVLVVDDDTKILYAFEQVLKRDGYECVTATSGPEALTMLSKAHPSVVFLDIAMPHLDGMQTLEKIKQSDIAVPVIMITGYGTMQTAISAMQMGAFDYLTKPIDISKVRELTRRAIASREHVDLAANQQMRFKADVVDRYELIGNHPTMQEVYKTIGSIAMTPNQSSVLITGESGTGKELVARAIHHSSKASSEPFVAINCTALPEALQESELFGHEKGSFTGAFERKFGKFEVAQRGTIFLDEIGTLPPSLQQKLLRALQEHEFERVGGNDKLTIEARFIAATNADLETEVKNQTFRKDLFFRLNVVAIHLPPLRDRVEDIPLLANYFLNKYSVRIKKSIKGFSNEAMSLLTAHTYPGNVRQLENIIERAVIFTKGPVILADALSDPINANRNHEAQLEIMSPVFAKSRDHVLGAFEALFIRQSLTRNHGNVSEAAKESGMTRQNYQRLMKKHKIKSDEYR